MQTCLPHKVCLYLMSVLLQDWSNKAVELDDGEPAPKRGRPPFITVLCLEAIKEGVQAQVRLL